MVRQIPVHVFQVSQRLVEKGSYMAVVDGVEKLYK